jgi:hypothetical protein
MVNQLAEALVNEFPDYIELDGLLRLAAKTWPLYGLSAADLARMDHWTLELIRVRLDT